MFETNGGMMQCWQRKRNDREKIRVRGLSKIESIIYFGFDISCKQLQI